MTLTTLTEVSRNPLSFFSYIPCVFPEIVPQATSVLWDRKIVLIKRVYTEGTIFMTPAVIEIISIN